MYNEKHELMKQEAIEAIIDALESGYSGYYCDLHNEVFNTDYYIIGDYAAREALREYDVFEAVDLVREYERFHFGEIYIDIANLEKLINMVYYIIGEEVILEIGDSIDGFWNEQADEDTNAVIVAALKAMF